MLECCLDIASFNECCLNITSFDVCSFPFLNSPILQPPRKKRVSSTKRRSHSRSLSRSRSPSVMFSFPNGFVFCFADHVWFGFDTGILDWQVKSDRSGSVDSRGR